MKSYSKCSILCICSIVLCIIYADASACSNGSAGNESDDTPTDYDQVTAPIKTLHQLGHQIASGISSGQLPYPHLKRLADYLLKRNNSKISIKKVISLITPILKTETTFFGLFLTGVIAAPLIGLGGVIYCICRQKNHCGGRRYQEDPPDTTTCGILGVLVTLCWIMLLLTMVMYIWDTETGWNRAKNLTNELGELIDEVEAYVNFTAVTEPGCMIEKTKSDLGTIISELNTTIISQVKIILLDFSNKIFPSLQNIIDSGMLTKLSYFTVNMTNLVDNVTDVSNKINKFQTEIENMAPLNGSPMTNNYMAPLEKRLDILRNAEQIHDMEREITSRLKKANMSEMRSHSAKAAAFVQDKISMEMEKLKIKSYDGLASLETKISRVQSYGQKIETSLEVTRTETNSVVSVEQIQKYQWIRSLFLSILIPLICTTVVVLFSLGCGTACYRPDLAPYMRDSTTNISGHFLYAGIIFGFVFGTIYMLASSILFGVGFTLENYACKPFRAYDLEYLDYTEDLFDSEDKDETASERKLIQIIRVCAVNDTFLEVFLPSSVNLEALLNAKHPKSKPIRVQELIATHLGITKKLRVSQNSLAKGRVTLQGYRSKINKPFPKPNFQPYEEFLDRQNNSLGNIQDLKDSLGDLKESIAALTDVRSKFLTLLLSIDSLLSQLSSNLTNTEKVVTSSKVKIEQKLNELLAVSIDKFVEAFRKLAKDTFLEFHRLTNCGKFRRIYHSGIDLWCQGLLHPILGLWLLLGMCSLAAIPLAIFGTQLALYFYKMDETLYKDAVTREKLVLAFPSSPPTKKKIYPSVNT